MDSSGRSALTTATKGFECSCGGTCPIRLPPSVILFFDFQPKAVTQIREIVRPRLSKFLLIGLYRRLIQFQAWCTSWKCYCWVKNLHRQRKDSKKNLRGWNETG